VLQAAEAVQDKNIARASLLPQADLQVSDSLRRINLQEQLETRFRFQEFRATLVR